nr:MAG TPA: hypothetical protein [Caudoviricetes sp.]
MGQSNATTSRICCQYIFSHFWDFFLKSAKIVAKLRNCVIIKQR